MHTGDAFSQEVLSAFTQRGAPLLSPLEREGDMTGDKTGDQGQQQEWACICRKPVGEMLQFLSRSKFAPVPPVAPSIVDGTSLTNTSTGESTSEGPTIDATDLTNTSTSEGIIMDGTVLNEAALRTHKESFDEYGALALLHQRYHVTLRGTHLKQFSALLRGVGMRVRTRSPGSELWPVIADLYVYTYVH